MNVALIYPAIARRTAYNIIDKAICAALPPISSGALYGFLRAKGYQKVKVFDEQLNAFDSREFIISLRQFMPDIIGISCNSRMHTHVLQMAQFFKSLVDIPIIVGGPQPTLQPESILNNKYVDYIMRGEGEKAFYQFLTEYPNVKNVPGLSYKDNGNIVHNKDVVLISDLDELPIFPYDIFGKDKGYCVGGLYISSRGCPHNCRFCSANILAGRKYRAHSAGRVVDDLEYLVKAYRPPLLNIMDDNFIVNMKRTFEIMELILSRGLKFKWYCRTRTDTLPRNVQKGQDLLHLMKRAGCESISFGFETATNHLLKEINKETTVRDHLQTIAMMRKAKMLVRGTFIFGIPGETRADSMETVKLAYKLDWAQFSLLTPYPGTYYYDKLKEENILPDSNQLDISGGFSGEKALPYKPPVGRTDREILKLQTRATILFWLHPKRMWNFVLGRMSPYGDPHRLGIKDITMATRVIFRIIIDKFKLSRLFRQTF